MRLLSGADGRRCLPARHFSMPFMLLPAGAASAGILLSPSPHEEGGRDGWDDGVTIFGRTFIAGCACWRAFCAENRMTCTISRENA